MCKSVATLKLSVAANLAALSTIPLFTMYINLASSPEV